MKNMNHQVDDFTGFDWCLWPMKWLIVMPIVVLQACANTTPELDAKWGMALTEAKGAQSLSFDMPEAQNDQLGVGRPSATEILRGLELHHKGQPAPTAIQVK